MKKAQFVKDYWYRDRAACCATCEHYREKYGDNHFRCWLLRTEAQNVKNVGICRAHTWSATFKAGKGEQ
jgi:hypothetical protein